MLTVYTDGGCHGNPGPSGWGVVIVDGSTILVAEGGYLGDGTNQTAEISAAIEGLKRTPEGATVELISDSQYCLKGISEWRAGWVRKGYRNSQGQPVANLELWKALWALVDKRKVKTTWVRGHSGNPHNERCDELATEAIKNRGAGAPAKVTPVAPAQGALALEAAPAPGITFDEMLAGLNKAIKASEHKPGDWATACTTMGGVASAGAHPLNGLGGKKEDVWGSFGYKRDAWLAVAAVNALPALLAEIERLRARQ